MTECIRLQEIGLDFLNFSGGGPLYPAALPSMEWVTPTTTILDSISKTFKIYFQIS